MSIVTETGLGNITDELVTTLHHMNNSANVSIEYIRLHRLRQVRKGHCMLRNDEEIAIILRHKDCEDTALWESFFTDCDSTIIGKL